ncbi:MAG: hypothetical protein ACRC0V_10945 [Fusobacteriaceae bacterium]
MVSDYVLQEARDENVSEIAVNLISSSAEVQPDEFNGWDCDWWANEIVNMANRNWKVSGCAFYGTVAYTAVEGEDENDDYE